MTTLDPAEYSNWIGRHALDNSGQKVGSVSDIYLDDATGQPEWLAVLTGLFGTRVSFVPLSKCKEVEEDIELGYEKSLVKDAPRVDADGELSVEEEEQLYRHYGLPYEPRLVAAEGGVEDLQGSGSTTISAEVSPEVALARLRRRDDEAVSFLGFDEDQDTPSDQPRS